MRLDQEINDYLPPNGGIVSRIAPTPSGFLHAGNAYNFILTYLLTRSVSGILHLRIDDYDLSRYRREFVQNIFDVLEFLGLECDKGPTCTSDFEQNFSFKVRAKRYEDVLEKLDEIYICECSRTTKGAYKNGIYTKICKDKNLKFIKDKTAIRLSIDEDDELGKAVSAQMGDFVIYKKDFTPAYNLASVIDDEDMGVNLVVRGEDLLPCTLAQRYIAKMLKFNFSGATFIHHKLLLKDGKKLSKSSKSPPIDLGSNPQIYYKILANDLGLDIKSTDKISNLLYEFKLKNIAKNFLQSMS
ncbi:glutamate--tRNA ligase family protein [Campylobacter concisus]|uniref:Glutamyl-queuosine tRNA(Asp) synthetase n=1 Tax=Campylobacter concisus TaxID=199 RepID=A0A0M4SLY3_9BACT|nr:glutamate--tRNA ligase family protein [Campylobacter concisus]ALF47221.1 glutamyl-queuosine tRNA(Asp) synthetase [Campylobacter concisus]